MEPKEEKFSDLEKLEYNDNDNDKIKKPPLFYDENIFNKKVPSFFKKYIKNINKTKFKINKDWLSESINNFEKLQKYMTNLSIENSEDQNKIILEMIQNNLIEPMFSETLMISIKNQSNILYLNIILIFSK